MLSPRALVLLVAALRATSAIVGTRNVPEIRVHKGSIGIDRNLMINQIITQYEIGQYYTFEVYLDETTMHDYMVNSCTMNGEEIISRFGCVSCGSCFTQSVETEAYNKPGAVKRTMISFMAQATTINFHCDLTYIDCSGCAERSCQRQDSIVLDHYHHSVMTLSYPPAGYAVGAFPIPIPPPNIYPTPPFGGYNMPPHAPPAVPPPVPVGPGGPAAAAVGAGVWPWWLWLLILLLLLLLLCCLLALCLAAFMKRKKERKAASTTVVTVADSGKDCAVGTDHISVNCVGTDTQDMVKVQPAMVLGAADLERHHHSHQHGQYSRSQAEYDQGSVMAGGSYSLREGMVHEGYTRTIPREGYIDRYASRDRFEKQMSQDNSRFTDRSSYRNFAYERDMGRVEPMDGYDEVETRERTYCLSDDDQEIVEKNVKRTKTTRYVTESREYEHDNEERMRGDEYHHATYTHSLPV